MNVRQVNRTAVVGRPNNSKPPLKSQGGFIRLAMLMAMSAVLVWSSFNVFGLANVSADAAQPEIRSAAGDYCIDDFHGSKKPASIVDAWNCNGTASQKFYLSGKQIKLDSKYCLDIYHAKVVLNLCSSSKTQDWQADGVGLMNNFNNQCLSLPKVKTGIELTTSSCDNLSSVNESWTPSVWRGKPMMALSSPACNQKKVGQRVACYAERQWLAWETEPQLRPYLLNDYTDGNAYEEWCADFVSYVYREAGQPFSGGERGTNGWDEYDANNIQYMGFSYHQAGSGYVPMPGDVAFFDYPGGHVEIVVSGGAHPTFIYGDSGTIDPVTRNGNMAKNQIVSDGTTGQVVYYLSPD